MVKVDSEYNEKNACFSYKLDDFKEINLWYTEFTIVFIYRKGIMK